jgi:aspartyl-tRNA(Asn)/glutamyl-tRNA(Gln) amidotransferase subunit B
MGELIRYLNEEKIGIEESPISPEKLVEMLKLIDKGVISGKMAKDIFEKMFKTGKDASQIVKESGITQIKALNYLVGQVMRYTKGRAKPDFVFNALKQRIKRGL